MILRLSSCLLALCMLTGTVTCQSLARKGSLGIRIHDLDDSLRQLTGATTGVYISEALPGGTAEAAGLRGGDVLLEAGGSSFSQTGEVIALSQRLRAGEPLTIKIYRAGKTRVKTVSVQGKPLESSKYGDVHYDFVPFQEGKLRSIIHKPRGKGPFPTLIFMQGYTCSSIDYFYDADFPIRQLIDGLVQSGYAVFRVEKPGVGDSEHTPDCYEIGYETEIAAFDAALSHFETYNFVDTERIFYFGHSLGGIAAPILAVEHQPRGVIVYGTVVKSWYEYLIDVYREQNLLTGADPVETEANVRRVIPALYQYLIEKRSPAELSQDPTTAAGLPLLNADGDQIFSRHYTFWQELQDHDLTSTWRTAGVPVLALYGEHDTQAISPEGARSIARIVNTYHPGRGEWQILPGTEHAMVSVPSMEAYVAMRADGRFNRSYMAEHFNEAIVETIVDWMQRTERSR